MGNFRPFFDTKSISQTAVKSEFAKKSLRHFDGG